MNIVSRNGTSCIRILNTADRCIVPTQNILPPIAENKPDIKVGNLKTPNKNIERKCEIRYYLVTVLSAQALKPEKSS